MPASREPCFCWAAQPSCNRPEPTPHPAAHPCELPDSDTPVPLPVVLPAAVVVLLTVLLPFTALDPNQLAKLMPPLSASMGAREEVMSADTARATPVWYTIRRQLIKLTDWPMHRRYTCSICNGMCKKSLHNLRLEPLAAHKSQTPTPFPPHLKPQSTGLCSIPLTAM